MNACLIAVIVIFACAVVLCSVACFLVAPKSADREKLRPFLCKYAAHRGLFTKDQSVPENSLPAFRRAVEYGYPVELDVQFTKDKQIVVFHDDTLLRACGIDARVDSLTYAEMCERCRLFGTEERIPLFSEVLAILEGHVAAIVEFKSSPEGDNIRLCERTLPMLRAYRGEYCVESFDPKLVRWFYQNAPDIVRGQLAEGYAATRQYADPFRAFLLSRVLTNCLTRPQFIAYHVEKKPLLVRLCEKMGALRVCWTAHEKDDVKMLQSDFDCVIFEHYLPPHDFADAKK